MTPMLETDERRTPKPDDAGSIPAGVPILPGVAGSGLDVPLMARLPRPGGDGACPCTGNGRSAREL